MNNNNLPEEVKLPPKKCNKFKGFWKWTIIVLMIIISILGIIYFDQNFTIQYKKDSDTIPVSEVQPINKEEHQSTKEKIITIEEEKNVIDEKTYCAPCIVTKYEKSLQEWQKKYFKLKLMTDFLIIKKNYLINQCNLEDLKQFQKDFNNFFVNKKTNSHFDVLYKNANSLTNKSNLITIFYSILIKEEEFDAKDMVKITNIVEYEEQKTNLLELINLINKNEWKLALDDLQKKSFFHSFEKKKSDILHQIQMMFAAENALRSLEGILSVEN